MLYEVITGASLEGLADEFASTGDAAATVTQAFDELFNSQLGVDQATISYRNGLADLKEQLLEGTVITSYSIHYTKLYERLRTFAPTTAPTR